MTIPTRILAAATCVTHVVAVAIVVESTGGNITGKFGHSYGYGFLHEDINNSGDGGIYAELIQNRAFQYSDLYPASTAHYAPINGAGLSIEFPEVALSTALPAALKVSRSSNSSSSRSSNSTSSSSSSSSSSTGRIGFTNDGYWGIAVSRQTYTGSFWVQGAYNGTFTASLQSGLSDGEVFGAVDIVSRSVAGAWTEHVFELVPERDAPTSNNTFALTFDAARAGGGGALLFNLISLFPPTYKGRKNGLRVDLADALAEMNPTFLRFPGGNMLEGRTNKTYWDWKDSLGPLTDRPGFVGVWGYQQTHGLGLLEYLQWAEDMNMQIVLAVWAGLALNGDTTPEQDLQPFIDDALDEIEFVTGPVDSPWGAIRAALGHPAPFELNYVEVGNEDWLAGYPGGWASYKAYRFPRFFEAIQAAHPGIQVISSAASSDPAPEGAITGPNTANGLDFAQFPGAMGDYHPYREPDELVAEFDRFDNDPTGHIIGEVAATHVNGAPPPRWAGPLHPYPWWIGAVGEAVSLLGYERNADRIPGTFYAPVLKNENRFQWPATLVQFTADPAQTTRAVTWYCWRLFAHHPISETLPTMTTTTTATTATTNSSASASASASAGAGAGAGAGFGPVYWAAGRDVARGGALVWKGAVYNTTDGGEVPVSVRFDGLAPGSRAALTVLTNSVGDPWAYNDPRTGVNIVETTTTQLISGAAGAFEFRLPQLSVAVLDTDVGPIQPIATGVFRGE